MAADDDERKRWREVRAGHRTVSEPELKSLWISRLPTGRYRIEVGSAAFPDALFSEEVQVRSAHEPMRLSVVTLEDHLQHVTLRVLTGDGHPVSKGLARLSGTSGIGSAVAIRDGVAELWLDRPRAVEVQVEGYSPLTIANVFADTVVSVEKE